MSLLRRLPTSRLLALCAGVVLLVGGGAAIATAAFSGGGPVPAPKALAPAIHDALATKPVQGITARVTFTNHLIDSASVQGGNPLLSGATGRLWLAPGGRARLELQSDNGDAQLVSDGKRFFAYDASSNTAYSGDLPRSSGKERAGGKERVPTVAEIERGLTRLMRRVTVLGPTPESTAGQPAYRVRVSPRHDGGLLGAAELSWDALHGVPLRAAVYAEGNSAPVLELKATQISYGAVPASTFAVSPPAGAKLVQVASAGSAQARDRHGSDRRHGAKQRGPQSVTAVSRALPFRLSAPDRLVGLPRRGVRLLDWNHHPGALVFYGRGLGGIAVIERPAGAAPAAPAAPARRGHRRQQLDLPKVSINGATGTELATALGTVVQFERAGISYTVLGSVPPAAAEAAARGL